MNRLLIKLLKFFIRRFARYHGFLDPIDLAARLTRFGQPSEVAVPTELLRAGAAMHARGLLNSQAIQYNMDWIWPYWVNRQFDPEDPSFVPRAFSLTHINLTHRNWTSVGLPDSEQLVLVDPRGLVTPFQDGWSIDFWMNPVDAMPRSLAEVDTVDQTLGLEGTPDVTTSVEFPRQTLESTVRVEGAPDVVEGPMNTPRCVIETRVHTDVDGWFTVALRPYNPEGVSTIDAIQVRPDRRGWTIRDEERETDLDFAPPPDRYALSNYDRGDVRRDFPDPEPGDAVECPLGMANAGASYRLKAGESLTVRTSVPLEESSQTTRSSSVSRTWNNALRGSCRLDVPDEQMEFLFESSKRTLLNLSGDDVYPGSFTYKRFWFRDATYMLNALLALGYSERVRNIIERYPDRQKNNGYFCSQKGEWDSNGQVLWLLRRYRQVTGDPLPRRLEDSIRRGADWIRQKRLPRTVDDPHAGLMPAGFSAEHFGPNDYYFWDDFWSVAGLRAAADLLVEETEAYREEARSLLACVENSLEYASADREDRAMSPSPYRSVDAGSVGNMVAGYPLQVFRAEDRRLLDTADVLREQCFVDGAFFQEMIHSGMNMYLTLHIAQVYLRAGRKEFWPILRRVADLASPTGKWPEAVHPNTGGGCMGDGEHGWAAADWILMVRNLFVREEGSDQLHLGSGLPEEWLTSGTSLVFGPTGTRFGSVTVELKAGDDSLEVTFESDASLPTPEVVIALDGFASKTVRDDQFQSVLKRRDSS